MCFYYYYVFNRDKQLSKTNSTPLFAQSLLDKSIINELVKKIV